MPRAASRPEKPAALVIAHPGHELRGHGWLEQAGPQVHGLTDGSGRSDRSRIPSSEALLARAGAEPGRIFGRPTDAQAYAALLDLQTSRFIELTDELAECLIGQRVQTVVGDAYEAYNPVHDVCRLIIDAAIAIAKRRAGRTRVRSAPDLEPSGCVSTRRPLQGSCRRRGAIPSWPASWPQRSMPTASTRSGSSVCGRPPLSRTAPCLRRTFPTMSATDRSKWMPATTSK
jgi:hypothetical protein